MSEKASVGAATLRVLLSDTERKFLSEGILLIGPMGDPAPDDWLPRLLAEVEAARAWRGEAEKALKRAHKLLGRARTVAWDNVEIPRGAPAAEGLYDVIGKLLGER